MSADIIDGEKLAEKTMAGIKKRVDKLKSKGITPKLDIILVGEDPASQVYVMKKLKASKEMGMACELHRFPGKVSTDELTDLIKVLNSDQEVHGILVQLPLPPDLDEREVLDSIHPEKDVDGLTSYNMGKLLTGDAPFEPCTPKGIIKMLEHGNIEVKGKNVVVVGRSNIVGKPLSQMLMKKNGTVTVCHSKTNKLKEHTTKADIIVVAVGKPKFVTADMVKKDAVVIDVGTNRTGDEVLGDVDFGQVKKKASLITPVPGGVGPMTVAMVLENTVISAERRLME